MNVPYTGDPRPDTGLYNGKLGLWLFMAFDVMFYGALVSAYVLLRSAATVWPAAPALFPLWFGILQTGALAAGAICAAQAWSALRVGPVGVYSLWLYGAMVAGLGYLMLSILALLTLAAAGAGPAESTLHGIYYVLTGVQMIHTLPAVGVSIVFAIRGKHLRSVGPVQFMNRLECLGLFWQFLALMGLSLFVLFYLI